MQPENLDALHATRTGPHTDAGKAASSRNAIKEGLFTANDFIRDGEQEEYDLIAAALRRDLAPEGALEELFTTEIVGAAWRLRRCRLVEASLATQSDVDPMQSEETGKTQKSVDRARAQSHSVMRRALAEMRKIQTERHLRADLDLKENYGMADFMKVIRPLMNKRDQPAAEPEPEPQHPCDMNPWDLDFNKPGHFEAFDHFVMTSPLGRPPVPNSFCKTESSPAETNSFCETPAPEPGRNAPCPCGSGQKYKKCCARSGKGWPSKAPVAEKQAA